MWFQKKFHHKTCPNQIDQTLDKRGYSGAVLMDLSKAFDTINHELFIAKFHAYGFNKESILDYLSNR